MHVFIDESGSFSGFQEKSVDVVAALAIPDTTLPKLTAKYMKICSDLPKKNGEVKGKSLNEKQVASIVGLLARYHVILEVSATDLGAHTLEDVANFQNDVAQLMEERMPRFSPSAQIDVLKTIDEILEHFTVALSPSGHQLRCAPQCNQTCAAVLRAKTAA